MERRRLKRQPRRLSVSFGEAELTGNGITRDVSADGAFIMAQRPPPIGTRLHLAVNYNKNRKLFFEAVVRRHCYAPPELRQVQQSGFAVTFLGPRELVEELTPAAAAAPVLRRELGDRAALASCMTQEIAMGGVFVHTDTEYAAGTPLRIELRLTFLERTLSFPARVVQVVRTPVRGIAVVFDDPAAVSERLSAAHDTSPLPEEKLRA